MTRTDPDVREISHVPQSSRLLLENVEIANERRNRAFDRYRETLRVFNDLLLISES